MRPAASREDLEDLTRAMSGRIDSEAMLALESQLAPQPSHVLIELRSSDLGSVSAALDVVWMSFEAAAIVIESDPGVGGAGRPDFTREHVRLGILDVAHGSVRLRFSVDPRTSTGRRRLLAIVTLGCTVAAALLPGLALVGAVAGGAQVLNEIVTPDELRSADMDRARDVAGTMSLVGEREQMQRLVAELVDERLAERQSSG